MLFIATGGFWLWIGWSTLRNLVLAWERMGDERKARRLRWTGYSLIAVGLAQVIGGAIQMWRG